MADLTVGGGLTAAEKGCLGWLCPTGKDKNTLTRVLMLASTPNDEEAFEMLTMLTGLVQR